MSSVVLILGSLMFGAMVLATKFHFRNDHISRQMKLISAISIIGFAVFIYGMVRIEPGRERTIVSALLILSSLMIFIWAISASKKTRLYLAFSELTPERIIRDGPYAYIRHPFYVSYIVFWAGCFVATFSFPSLLILFIISIIYVRAARLEEMELLKSPMANEYRIYIGKPVSKN